MNIKYLLINLLLVSLLVLPSCKNPFRYTDAREVPVDAKERVQKNIEEGRGITLLGGKKKGGVFDFASSNELWRASLDTLEFMPLISADYGGGILITDWYNENNNYEDYIKISVRFLTNEIRSDALNVKVYTKKCVNVNECIINEDNPEIKNKLVSTILTKASKYKQDQKAQRRKIKKTPR